MQKSLALILFAASSLGVGAGSTFSFAAEEANPKAIASPEATPPQSSRKKMHQPSQRKMHRMQKTGSGKPLQSDSAAAPNPSQRSMRQKLKKAKPSQTPATGNPEAH